MVSSLWTHCDEMATGWDPAWKSGLCLLRKNEEGPPNVEKNLNAGSLFPAFSLIVKLT